MKDKNSPIQKPIQSAVAPQPQMPSMGNTMPEMKTQMMDDPMARPMGEVPEQMAQSPVMGYKCGGIVHKK